MCGAPRSSSPPPTAAAPPRSCADPSGHRSADHRRGYRPQDSLSIQSTFPSKKGGGGRDDSHPNSLLTGKITGNFEKNANSPCHGGKGGPSNKEAEAKFHPFSYLSDKEWVVLVAAAAISTTHKTRPKALRNIKSMPHG